jgi:hypothetical protein
MARPAYRPVPPRERRSTLPSTIMQIHGGVQTLQIDQARHVRDHACRVER